MNQVTQQRFYDMMEQLGPEEAVNYVLAAALFAAQDGLHPNGGAKWVHPPECQRITDAVFGKDERARRRFEQRVHKHLQNMLASEHRKRTRKDRR